MTSVAAAFLYLLFLLLGCMTLAPRLRARFGAQCMVSVFLAYVLVATCLPGFSQRELWPFSAWKLIASRVPTTVESPIGGLPRFLAVTADGQEHEVDFRAVEPLAFDELLSWSAHVFPRLQPEEKDAAFSYLLARVNANVAAAQADPRWAAVDRLGAASAPYFVLHPRRWPKPALPAEMTGLRLYAERWHIQRRWRGIGEVERTLIHEYRRE
jgi:hypothetical protein